MFAARANRVCVSVRVKAPNRDDRDRESPDFGVGHLQNHPGRSHCRGAARAGAFVGTCGYVSAGSTRSDPRVLVSGSGLVADRMRLVAAASAAVPSPTRLARAHASAPGRAAAFRLAVLR